MSAVGLSIQSQVNADKFTASYNFFWFDLRESETVELNRNDKLKADARNLAGNRYIKAGK